MICIVLHTVYFRRIYRYLRSLHRSSTMTKSIACGDVCTTEAIQGFLIDVN